MTRTLIIWGSNHWLHYFEFVKPIEALLKEQRVFVRHYSELKESHIQAAHSIIICGTSLMNKGYPVSRFKWLLDINKPVLGICAGMQLIGKLFGCRIIPKREIGLKSVFFNSRFLGLEGHQEVYEMHNYGVIVNDSFSVYAKTEIPQAIKHKTKAIYGVLFHPEARTKELIRNFITQKI